MRALFFRPIGATVDLEKCEKNAPTLAIVGTHTAENEPSKVFAEMGGPL